MTCLLPVLFLMMADLGDPTKAIAVPADMGTKKDLMLGISAEHVAMRDFWVYGAHKSCQAKKGKTWCASAVYVFAETSHASCVETTLATEKK